MIRGRRSTALATLAGVIWFALFILCVLLISLIGQERINDWTNYPASWLVFVIILIGIPSVLTILISNKIWKFMVKQQEAAYRKRRNLNKTK